MTTMNDNRRRSAKRAGLPPRALRRLEKVEQSRRATAERAAFLASVLRWLDDQAGMGLASFEARGEAECALLSAILQEADLPVLATQVSRWPSALHYTAPANRIDMTLLGLCGLALAHRRWSREAGALTDGAQGEAVSKGLGLATLLPEEARLDRAARDAAEDAGAGDLEQIERRLILGWARAPALPAGARSARRDLKLLAPRIWARTKPKIDAGWPIN